MKICPNCGTTREGDAAFCPNCGTAMQEAPAPVVEAPVIETPVVETPVAEETAPVQPVQEVPAAAPVEPKPVGTIDYSDHTAEFDADDIAENKLYAIVCYLAGWLGIIVALLAAKESPYAKFHIRQVLRCQIVELMLVVVGAVLGWTIIGGFAAFAAVGVLAVIEIIGFVWTCQGKAKELPILKSIKFLK